MAPRRKDSEGRGDALALLPVVHDLEVRLVGAESKFNRTRRTKKVSRGVTVLATLLVAIILVVPLLSLFTAFLRLQSERSPAQLFLTLSQPESAAAERKDAFLRLVALGHVEWKSAHLEVLDLNGSNLSKTSLTFANLRGATLVGADLKGADLSNASLETVDASGASLVGADLRQANIGKHSRLAGCDFSDADLRRTFLGSAYARGARFHDAEMKQANLNLADLSGADFENADLRRANLYVANLRDANLRGAHLKGANLDKADFTNANWWRARGLKKHRQSLEESFPPTADADPELRADYQAWLKEKDAKADR